MALSLLLGLSTPALAGQELGTIRVQVIGIAAPIGTLKLSLDNSEDSFLGKNNTQDFKVGATSALAPTSDYLFPNVPFGTYAIKLFHDANDNDQLDTNLLGIPAEAYGVSNDARGMFGLPAFADAAFVHRGKETVLTIHIRPHLSSAAH